MNLMGFGGGGAAIVLDLVDISQETACSTHHERSVAFVRGLWGVREQLEELIL
jgi:hypothetical protein